MASLKEIRRRSLVPLAGLALAAFYLLGFVPLSNRSQSLDAPLQRAWLRLQAALEQTNSTAPVDFLRITNQLAETRQAVAAFADARQAALARIEPGAALRARLNAPFQLVDFQNERSKQQDSIAQAAKQVQVTLDTNVFGGFPEHTADVKQPELLWAALAFVDTLLTTAVEARVSAIHALAVPVALTNPLPTNSLPPLVEIPVQVEFTASMPAVARLFQALPMRSEEARAAGLTAAPPDKSVLFLDRFMVKKQTPEKPDEARVWLRVVGFIPRE
jgi:hypothetical protein